MERTEGDFLDRGVDYCKSSYLVTTEITIPYSYFNARYSQMSDVFQIHPICTELDILHACVITEVPCSSSSLAPHFLGENLHPIVGLCTFLFIKILTIHNSIGIIHFTNLEYKHYHITITFSHAFLCRKFPIFLLRPLVFLNYPSTPRVIQSKGIIPKARLKRRNNGCPGGTLTEYIRLCQLVSC